MALMKLYYSPGVCSLSPHIVLRESGLDFEAIQANSRTHKLLDGSDYYAINPLGYVPLLELDDGTRLREGPVIVQYVADQVPARNLIPAAGTLPRYRVQEWLNFAGSELHKSYSPLFNPAMPEEGKQIYRDKLRSRYEWIDQQLQDRDYLTGERFCVADAYVYTVTRWAGAMKLDLSAFPRVLAFQARVEARPAVQDALRVEGLLK
jgi:glutathione S-transferase